MLLSIRDKMDGWIKWIIVIVLIVVFSLWGMSYYIEANHANMNSIAVVNGESVSQTAFQNAYQTRLEAVVHQGQTPDVKALQQEALSAVIQRTLLLQAAQKLKLTVPQDVINQVIKSLKVFQVDGVFSPTQFQAVLARNGLTELGFSEEISRDMRLSQLQMGLFGSDFVLPFEVQNYLDLQAQTRDVSVVQIPDARFLPALQVSDSEVQRYYQTHALQFMAPETVQIQYLLLDNPTPSLLSQLQDLTASDPTSLAPAANALKLPIHVSKPFTAQGLTTGIAHESNILRAAFSDFVLNDHMNSDLIDLPHHQFAVLRVIQNIKAHPQPLSDVQPEIVSLLKQQLAAQQASQEAERLSQALSEHKPVPSMDFKNDGNLTRTSQALPKSVVLKAFNQFIPIKGESINTWVYDPNTQSAYLIVLHHVQNPTVKPTSAQVLSAIKTLKGAAVQGSMLSFIHQLHQSAKIVSHLGA